jgi:hypothetical protein
MIIHHGVRNSIYRAGRAAHIVVSPPSDRVEASCPYPRDWIYINSARFNEAMRDAPTSTRAGRKARKKA